MTDFPNLKFLLDYVKQLTVRLLRDLKPHNSLHFSEVSIHKISRLLLQRSTAVDCLSVTSTPQQVRVRSLCDGTYAETNFCLSLEWMSPCISAVHQLADSTVHCRQPRCTCHLQAYEDCWRGSVIVLVAITGYSLHSPVFPSLPICAELFHHIVIRLHPFTGKTSMIILGVAVWRI